MAVGCAPGPPGMMQLISSWSAWMKCNANAMRHRWLWDLGCNLHAAVRDLYGVIRLAIRKRPPTLGSCTKVWSSWLAHLGSAAAPSVGSRSAELHPSRCRLGFLWERSCGGASGGRGLVVDGEGRARSRRDGC